MAGQEGGGQRGCHFGDVGMAQFRDEQAVPHEDHTVAGGGDLRVVRDDQHRPLELTCAADRLGFPIRDDLPCMLESEARSLDVLKLNTSDEGVPTVRSMVLAMDGAVVDVGGTTATLDTVSEELNDEGNTENVATLVRFSGLGLIDEIFHTVGSPPMAYLFFIIGLCLLIFEFYTAGVGVAGFVGAVLTIFGCFGFSVLPTRPGAIALLVVAMVAFAIDVQVGIPRLWTGVGTTLFVLGSWFLYEPLPGHDLRLGWLTLFVGISGVLLTFIVGMPSMVRTRFATPTIGREWMIGSQGVAIGAISPEGVAQVGEALGNTRKHAVPLATELDARGITRRRGDVRIAGPRLPAI